MKNSRILKIIIIIITIQRHQAQALTAIIRMEGKYSEHQHHFDPDCGGKNSYQTTLEAAKSAGLTPCKKCAQ